MFQTIVQGQKGWDFLVSWVMHSINARKRRRLVRNTRQESQMEEGEAAEYWGDESDQSNPSINNSFRWELLVTMICSVHIAILHR